MNGEARSPSPDPTDYAHGCRRTGCALVALGIGELFVWWRFEAAQAADRANQADGCLDECIGTWLGILFWQAMFFMWPVIWVVIAGVVRFIWSCAAQSKHETPTI